MFRSTQFYVDCLYGNKHMLSIFYYIIWNTHLRLHKLNFLWLANAQQSNSRILANNHSKLISIRCIYSFSYIITNKNDEADESKNRLLMFVRHCDFQFAVASNACFQLHMQGSSRKRMTSPEHIAYKHLDCRLNVMACGLLSLLLLDILLIWPKSYEFIGYK